MYNKRWIIKNITEENKEKIEYYAEKYKVPKFVIEMCIKRGIKTDKDLDTYFAGAEGQLTDPFNMRGMDEATERIAEAVDNGEIITIFGDYDADGVTATSILYYFLTGQTESTVYFRVPDRFKEGYGLSENAVREMAKDGTGLIITVDCGIKSVEEIKLAYELGMNVVVTDHHTKGDILPNCEAIVNPVLEDDESPFKFLCGAGVAYKLCEALGTVFGCDDDVFENLIAMAAIGTMADSVNLVRENRVIVNKGLEYIKREVNPGITSLMGQKKAEIGKIIAKDISFTIVPKINVAGRMGSAERAIELLTTPDKYYAEKIAAELEADNIKRKETESAIFKEAMEETHLYTNEDDKIVVALGEGWHHGVIGIVSQKIEEKTGKLSFVFATEKEEPGIARGSARSIEGFDLRKSLDFCADLLVKYGGHEKAAGLSIKIENIRKFIDKMNEYYEAHKDEISLMRKQEVDCILPIEDITVENFRGIIKMQPFGEGNGDPIICTSNVEVCDIRFMSEGKHVKVSFKGADKSGRPVYFSATKFNCPGIVLPGIGERVSVLYKASINEYMGKILAEPTLEDICECCFTNGAVEKGEEKIYNEVYISNEGFYLNRSILAVLFKCFTIIGGKCEAKDINRLKDTIKRAGKKITRYQIVYGLAVFKELGLITLKNGVYEIAKSGEKKNLEDSRTFRELS